MGGRGRIGIAEGTGITPRLRLGGGAIFGDFFTNLRLLLLLTTLICLFFWWMGMGSGGFWFGWGRYGRAGGVWRLCLLLLRSGSGYRWASRL
jgi:hypothetical protein